VRNLVAALVMNFWLILLLYLVLLSGRNPRPLPQACTTNTIVVADGRLPYDGYRPIYPPGDHP
jgi:hypothetical protein